MGHIYSLDEYRFKKIPNKLGYQNAIRVLKDGLQNLVNHKILYGVTCFGSLTSTDFEIGSDIDLFVVTESTDGEDKLRKLVIEITEKTYVFFDIKLVHRNMAEAGLHRVLYFYIHTIKKFSNRWIIGKDPVEIVRDSMNWKDIRVEMINDMLTRMDFLIKSRINIKLDFGVVHCSYLDRIVTFPVYAAIGVVRLKYNGQPADENGKRLSKVETLELYGTIVPEKEAKKVLEILNHKNEYRKYLMEQNGSIHEYMKKLEQIDHSHTLACQVLEFTAGFLNRNKII